MSEPMVTHTHPVVAEDGWVYVLVVRKLSIQFPRAVFRNRARAQHWAKEHLDSDDWWLDYVEFHSAERATDDGL